MSENAREKTNCRKLEMVIVKSGPILRKGKRESGYGFHVSLSDF